MNDACICLGVDDGPDVCAVHYRTARVEHICCECGATINPGEKYEQVNGCWDGRWDCFKTCTPCRNMRNDLFNCGFYYGDLFRTIREYLKTDPLTGEDLSKDED